MTVLIEESKVIERLEGVENALRMLIELVQTPGVERELKKAYKERKDDEARDALQQKDYWSIGDVAKWAGVARQTMYTTYRYLLPNHGEPTKKIIVNGHETGVWLRDEILRNIPADKVERKERAMELLREYEDYAIDEIKKVAGDVELQEAAEIIARKRGLK